MDLTMKTLLLFIFLNLTLISNVAAENAYFGASFGDARTTANNYNTPIGYKFYLGGHLNDRFGAEIGFIELGEFKRNTTTNKISGTEISAVGFIPLGNDGSIFVKLGLFNWNSKTSNGETDGSDFTIGLGVQLPIKDNILFRIEYQEFRDINNSSDNYTFLSVGAALVF